MIETRVPRPGEVWRNKEDENHGLLREIRIDRVDEHFVFATGVQSGRATRIRLRNGRLPSYYPVEET